MSASDWPDFAVTVTLARPKSRILIESLVVMKRFSGLMSRWTMPLACATARACATWVA
jgi:hypothetical protein